MKKLTYKQRKEIAAEEYQESLKWHLVKTIKFWWKNRVALAEVDSLQGTSELLKNKGLLWLSSKVREQSDRIWVDVYAPKE